MMKYGVVQGRLVPQVDEFIQSFPTQLWRQEFLFARDMGASHIEWIDGAPHDEFTLRSVVADDLAVPISAVCLDWFVSANVNPLGLINCPRFDDVIYDAKRLGIDMIVIPFLEQSSFADAMLANADLCVHVMDVLSQRSIDEGLTFAIETDLGHRELFDLMKDRPRSMAVTFDTGNLIKLGFDPSVHMHTYLDRIVNVHVKDCVRASRRSVQLGTGELDVSLFKDLLQAPNLRFVTFQTARAPGDEVETFRHNVRTIEHALCH